MYKKKFLAKVVLASALVGGVNLLPVPNIDAGNVEISVAYAENKNFSAKDGAMTDVELIEAQAKEASRLRAIEAVKEKIASYVRNFSGAKGKLTEDDIAAIAEKFEQVGETKYKKLFYNAVDEDGKELGKVGIMYEATVTAKFNSKKITEYIKLNAQEKEKRIRQAREARAKFEELDREYEELRKNARNKTPEQLQSEIKDFDDKISDLEKSRNKNKSAKKNKPTTQKNKIVSNVPMQFYNLVEIGEFGQNMRSGGISIRKASYVSEAPNQSDPNNATYSNGVARFGDKNYALYLHYSSMSDNPFKLGSDNLQNAIPYNFVWTTILKLNVTSEDRMYFLRKNGNVPSPYKHYTLIGCRPDGKWVKYFDTEDLCQQYLGNSKNVSIKKITLKGDTIIANYARSTNPSKAMAGYFHEKEADEFGEFRFKWDESAKWFGVEKITYNQTPTEQKTAQENKIMPQNTKDLNINEAQKYYELAESEWKTRSEHGIFRPQNVIDNYNRAINLNPNFEDAYIGRSVSYAAEGFSRHKNEYLVKSLEDLKRALEINPNSARAYCWSARLNYEFGNSNQAMTDANKAIDLDKNFLDAYEMRAYIFSKRGDWDRAIIDYTYILNFPNLRNSSYREHLDFVKLQQHSSNREINKRIAQLYIMRGEAYYYKGIKDKAFEDFERAFDLTPNVTYIGYPVSRKSIEEWKKNKY